MQSFTYRYYCFKITYVIETIQGLHKKIKIFQKSHFINIKHLWFGVEFENSLLHVFLAVNFSKSYIKNVNAILDFLEYNCLMPYYNCCKCET